MAELLNEKEIKVGTASGISWYLKLVLTETSYSIENNTSQVKRQLYLRASNTAYSISFDSRSAWIGDNKVKIAYSHSGKSHILIEDSVTVDHNDDGSGTYSIGFGISTSFALSGSSTCTLSLTSLPRTTTPTVSVESVELGKSVTISTPRATDSFTHKLYYSIANSGLQLIASDVATSYSWTVPMSLANYMPSSTSGTLTITSETYNGYSLVGAKTVTMTVTVPASIVPSVSSISISEAVSSIASEFGCYVKSKSHLVVGISASGSYSSTITSYQTKVDGVTYNNSSFTTYALKTSGTLTITTTVTDSRGRTASKSEDITVYDYYIPKISNFKVDRCLSDGTIDDDGTSVRVTFSHDIAPVNNKNTVNIVVQYLNFGVWETLTQLPQAYLREDYSTNITSVEFDKDKSYEFRVVITDYFANSVAYAEISTSYTLINFNESGRSLALGKASESEDFEIDMDIDMHGHKIKNVTLEIDLPSVDMSGYVTEEELDSRGYALQTSVSELSEEIADLDKEVAHYFTPEMYGAKGNGSNDDSTAIQSAIDNAGSTGIVYLAKKTYKITKPIEITHSNRTFVCEGTLSYSGTDSAILIGSHSINADIHHIDAPNGTALKIGYANKYIEHCKININKIVNSKIGLHIYTDTVSITYNQIRIGFVNATETGIFVECLASYINENYYWLGKITGCNIGIRLHSASTLDSSAGFGTNDNYFYSGSLEGITTCAISIENSSGNKFNNLRCQEHYGDKVLVMTGFCKNNDITLSRIYTKEIDITGHTGGEYNILRSSSIYDIVYGQCLGTEARIDSMYGLTYNPIYANCEVTVTTSTFANNVIERVNTLIPTSLYFTDTSLNGKAFSLSAIYSNFMSMARGFPLCLVFSATGGKIILQDARADTVLDNSNGEYAGKTLSVRWNGYDKINAKNIWDIQVLGDVLATKDYVQSYAQPKGNYLTSVPSEYVTESELSAKGYTTTTSLNNHINDTTKHITSAERTTWNAKSNFSGSYTDLTNKPTIPSKTSQLTNDSGFLTQHQSLSGYLTVAQGDAKYQPKGNYMSYSDIEAKETILTLADGTQVIRKVLVLIGQDIPVVSYTNQVPISIGTDKNIFNGSGYQNGYRLNSSGLTKEQTNSTVTGFIPAKSGDVIRIKGYKWYDTSNSLNYLCAYDSSFNFIGGIISKGTAYTKNPTSSMTGTDEEAVLTIANISTIAYVRISVYEQNNNSLTGANLIVTVNQEIK